MYHKKKIKQFIISTLLIFALLFSGIYASIGISFVFADDTSKYSNVLDDLSKVDNFNFDNYPQKDKDYSLQVIQVAESSTNELFVYVYQPSGQEKDLRASAIRISQTVGDDVQPKDYALTYLNSSGVFYKYSVSNFVLSTQDIRYYLIISIFRLWDRDIDATVDGDNTVNEVTYAVGKRYTVQLIDNQLTYLCEYEQVIEITDKYIGHMRYSTASNIFKRSCDSHFVAFQTDLPMDKLFEVDIDYSFRTYQHEKSISSVGINITYGPTEKDSKTLNYTDKVTVGVNRKYTWDRISTVKKFVEDEKDYLSDSAKLTLLNKQWVLRFYESDYKRLETVVTGVLEKGTEVREVTILRLKFDHNDTVYNLGVVDNKQTGSLDPAGERFPELPDWLKKLIGILIGIVLLLILIPLLPFFVQGIWYATKYICIGLWWVITLPYRLIKRE